MKTSAAAISAFLYISLLQAAELPKYPCYQLSIAPVLDGKIEEDAWQKIPSATGFFVLGGGYASKQTSFKAGWTADALYLALRAEEPYPEKILAKNKDGGALWSEDGVEIFIAVGETGKFLQFIINAGGSRWNRTGPETVPEPIWNWRVATYIGDDFWSAEIEIPYDILATIPGADEVWRINIARNILTGPSSERLTCWPPLQHSFSEIENFGFFVFKNRSLSPADVPDIEASINAGAASYLKKEINQAAETFILSEAILREGQKREKFRKEASCLLATGEFIKKVAQEKGPVVRKLSSASAKSANLLQRLEKLKNEILLEQLFEE